jgi:putative ABC transport system permease protein
VARLKEGWGAQHKLFVITVAEFMRDQRALLAQATAAVYPLIALATVIALLGIVTSLLAAIVDRVREIAVLRAIGATRRQIARSVVVESALLGLAAGVLAACLGSVLGYFEVELLIRELFNMSVLYSFPAGSVLLAVLIAPALAALAGYLPGRRAARLRFGDALRYE